MRSKGYFNLACLLTAVACAPLPQPQPATPATAPSVATPSVSPTQAAAPSPAPANSITANIEARSGSTAKGTVTLTEGKPGLHVVVLVSGIAPGKHGLHFHENGDCSAPDATSAKGHFNPAHHDHGLPTSSARHLGDLGNIEVGVDGHGRLEVDLADASLTPGAENSLHGKAVILHAKVDDGSQPAGNAGERIGCAVIP